MNAFFHSVVITGASTGIGADLAREVASCCRELVLVARRGDLLDALAQELMAAHPVVAHVVVADLAQTGSACALWDSVQALVSGPVDLVVNNAGFGLGGPYLETSLLREEEMVALNVQALMVLGKLAVQDMARRKRGYLLNVASVASFQPGPGMAVYFASKAFVLQLSEALAWELRPAGIQVTALCPGTTDTEFHAIARTTRTRWLHRLTRSSPRAVAQAGLQGLLQGKTIVIPGLLNRLAVLAVRFLPRSLVTRFSAAALRSP